MPRWNFLNISHNKNIHLRGQTCCNVNFVQGKNTKNVLISQYAECKIVSEIVYKNIIIDIFSNTTDDLTTEKIHTIPPI